MGERAARVLVVDDDPEIREILRRFLCGKGYEVETVDDGASALESIPEYGPDVVLLDIRMPGLDGVEVLRRIGDEEMDCGVIMISGEADEQVARETLRMGAADFIYKPFDLAYLETSLFAKLVAMGRP